MSANSTNITPLFATSKKILLAQELSNIVWGILCILAILMGTLQIITTIVWKPLRKVEQTLIFALAITDWLKTAGFGALVIRRLYETAIDADDVGSQQSCMIWLIFMMAPLNTVFGLVVGLSAERLLGLAAPVWYKVQRLEFRLYLIAASVVSGVSIAGGMLIGASPTTMIPVCAFASSPVEAYRTFAQTFEHTMTCLTLALNLVSCALLIGRWRSAVRAKKDMKTFKKSLQFSALKMLLVVVGFFLFSSTMGALWITIIDSAGWNDSMRMSYAPLGGCFELIRGVVDFPCYVIMVKEYRTGFKEVILKKLICCHKVGGASTATTSLTGTSTSAVTQSNGNRRDAVVTAHA